MTIPTKTEDLIAEIEAAPECVSFDAYYYSLDATNCRPIDAVLSAVARAGKSFHNTDDWNEELSSGGTAVSRIQESANDSAATVRALIARIRELEEAQRLLMQGIKAVTDLIDESEGVSGLHLNGDVAAWSELRTGGHFEPWLLPFDEALEAIK